ncbi:glycosyltransferase family 2 protein [Wenzhouxiangella sp. EGI_FJ10305]|uniref:glycosyltransferase family 2 protein n=1 Tax=Wenzhouxiangella sp. EGI_FJ10305 TaxID=3243768 RepID=UPI0035DBAD65
MSTDKSGTEIPELSIVVIFHEMEREANRTLFSLSRKFQEYVEDVPYEVIAIDNGSKKQLGKGFVEPFGGEFRYEYFDTSSVSPAAAVNRGIRLAKGTYVAIIVDGARMASPGLVSRTLMSAKQLSEPAVFSLAWHLGDEVQNLSMLSGYNQSVEDELLESVNWKQNGRKLFDISVLAQSSGRGFFGGVPSEFSWICVRKALFATLGGFNEAFTSKGGGMVNHDFRNRLMMTPRIQPLMLLGEGVFHQFHGGVATNVPKERHPLREFRIEYERIHGRPYEAASTPEPLYFGSMPKSALRFISNSR